MRFSMRRRVMNMRRSMSFSRQPDGALTNTWRMRGMDSKAMEPKMLASTGTSRHQATCKVSCKNSSSMMALYWASKASSWGKKIMPTAKFFARCT